MSLSIISGLRKIVAAPDIALDLGTANTRLYAVGRGLIADEPSMVKFSLETGRVEAVGMRAALMINGNSKVSPVSPLRAGVIADVDAAASLLQPLMWRARKLGIMRPRALACAPTDATDKERAALIEATRRAGASSVAIAPEPLAAAIGAGLDVSSPYAQMIVDIGDGVTDIAVIRSGELVSTSAVRKACSDLHSAISNLAEERYKIHLHPREAERLILEVGAMLFKETQKTYTLTGIDCITEKEKSVSLNAQEISDVISPVIYTIVRAVKAVVKHLPPMTSCEVIENGLCLTGGGAGLRGLSSLLSSETGLDVRSADDPMHAVINGARQILAVRTSVGLWEN